MKTLSNSTKEGIKEMLKSFFFTFTITSIPVQLFVHKEYVNASLITLNTLWNV